MCYTISHFTPSRITLLKKQTHNKYETSPLWIVNQFTDYQYYYKNNSYCQRPTQRHLPTFSRLLLFFLSTPILFQGQLVQQFHVPFYSQPRFHFLLVQLIPLTQNLVRKRDIFVSIFHFNFILRRFPLKPEYFH